MGAARTVLTDTAASWMASNSHLERTVSNSDTKAWPQMADYPQTELGWNRYANDWVARRRMTGGLGQIPKAAVEEHWAAMALGRGMGWEETEVGECGLLASPLISPDNKGPRNKIGL